MVNLSDSNSRQCCAQNCYANTSELKPFCLRHVSQHSYAVEKQVELEAQAEEIELANAGSTGHIDVEGAVAQDILVMVIAAGDVGVHQGSIERSTGLKPRGAKAYIRALKRAELVLVRKYPGRANRVHLRSK